MRVLAIHPLTKKPQLGTAKSTIDRITRVLFDGEQSPRVVTTFRWLKAEKNGETT